MSNLSRGINKHPKEVGKVDQSTFQGTQGSVGFTETLSCSYPVSCSQGWQWEIGHGVTIDCIDWRLRVTGFKYYDTVKYYDPSPLPSYVKKNGKWIGPPNNIGSGLWYKTMTDNGDTM